MSERKRGEYGSGIAREDRYDTTGMYSTNGSSVVQGSVDGRYINMAGSVSVCIAGEG